MKVYVSSTFRDLRQHRAAVDLTLRRMGHDVIGMEQYVAEGSRPLDRCLLDVARSDVYVMILAWRYGYAPPNDNPLRRSITELEYREAIARGKHILVFLLDPDVPWPPSAMDSMSADPSAANGIALLRAEVGRDYLAGVFTSAEDLASQVAAAIARLGLSGQLSQRVLNNTSVTAVDMGGFGIGAQLRDTSLHSVKEMVVEAGTDRAIVIDLGNGDQWWSTRLFILASLLRTLTLVRQVVFRGPHGRFAGMASPDAIIDGLGTRFPLLAEYSRRINAGDSTQDRDRETERQVDIWFQMLSEPEDAAAGAAPAAKVPAGSKTASSGRRATTQLADGALKTLPREQREQIGVRVELLGQWLGERLVSRCVQIRDNEFTMSQVQQIVDCLLPDVPVEIEGDSITIDSGADSDKGPHVGPSVASIPPRIYVVDRDSFGLELAREWVRSGLPRNPAG